MKVIIIGAGVVGLSIAVNLRRAGVATTVIDRQALGQRGASYGNAGMISAAIVAPSSMPGMIRQVPRWLLDPQGPLVMRPSHVLRAMPWLLRWLEAGRESRVRRISTSIHALHRDAFAQWRSLLGNVVYDRLIVESGQVLGSEAPAKPATARLDRELREAAGIDSERLDRAALLDLFPGLAASVTSGLLLRGNGFCRDPQALLVSLAESFVGLGGRLVPQEATALSSDGLRWTVKTDESSHFADKVVVAAGAWSRPLLKPLGISVPLEAERGYHAMLPDPSIRLPMPISVRSRGAGLAPMSRGLRVAGTVELAGLSAPPDPSRAIALAAHAKSLFPALEHGTPTTWMGPRPGMPDSLPVLGPVPRHRDLFVCFGHGHTGLTSAPATALMMKSIILGQQPADDVSAYRLSRFG